ncbi:hypothetical protein HHK36_015833 [Tetracentron sinense]|uniref:Uncharacterized protein n=1 Tax=Tetracentron sinense TaxID=13715 RepID=A0A835DE94_TETSI|nr:hypothetical protein HHK36_015833 [Tetracentron sinense]
MACCCRTMFRSVFLTEPWLTINPNRTSVSSSIGLAHAPATPRLSRRVRVRVRDFHRGLGGPLKCSNGEASSSSSQDEQGPPQEAVLKAISEVSKTEGRVGQTTNVVIGGTVTDDSTNEWLALDQKVPY